MLKKCFYIRHQAGGILTDVVYLVRPTDEQVATAKAKCEEVHGTHHVELGEHWTIVQEGAIEVPDGFDFSKLEDVPAPEPAKPSGDGEDGKSALPRFIVSGTGTVTPPKK